MSSSKKFAVFDIDGTISRNSLFLQIVDELLATGHLPQDARKTIDDKLADHRQRTHTNTYEGYAVTAVDILFGNIASISVKDYRHAVDSVIARTAKHSYVYTTKLVKKLQKQGYTIIALSGSEMYSVEQFTKHYGIDIAVGEAYEQKDGKFTGKINQVIHAKGQFLKELVEKHDLSFKDSYAIGDTKSDIGMLELVDNPIAFNPEARLLAHAKEHHWTIVVERKNVAYELKDKDGIYILA